MFNKKPYSLIITVMVILLALTGCSSSTSKTEVSVNKTTDSENKDKEQSVQAGGDFTFALSTAPDTLDPHASGMAVATRVIKSIFESLVYQEKDNTIKPWLATEWSVSDNKKEYTFSLREGVKFHDGTDFNADAVKYNIERIFDVKTKAFTAATYLSDVESVEVVDTHKIKFILKQPSATFLTILAHSNLSIVSKEAAEKAGDKFGLHPIGTGPFKFVEQVENDRIVLAKFEEYNGAYPFAKHDGPAYLDKLTFKIVPEEATRVGSVQSNQLQAAETVPPQDILAIEKSGQLKLWEVETGGLPYTLFVNNTTAPWNDVKARQALKAGIDVESIVNTLYLGTYKRAWSALTSTTFGYDDSLEGKDGFNVKKSNQLFEELGWEKGKDGIREKDGNKLTLRILNDAVNREKRQDISIMVKEQLKAVGIDVIIETTSEARSVLADAVAYDLRGNSRVAIDPDDLRLFYHSKQTTDKGGINLAWYQNAEVDQWLEAATTEQDAATRENLYKQIQNKLIEEVAIIPIYVFPYTVATSLQVQDLAFDSIGYPLFYDVNLTQ